MQNVLIINDKSIKIIVFAYSVFKDSQKTALWLKTRNANLGGFSPIQLMQAKKYKPLLALMNQDADEAIKQQEAPEGVLKEPEAPVHLVDPAGQEIVPQDANETGDDPNA
jgi:hypothetical protein